MFKKVPPSTNWCLLIFFVGFCYLLALQFLIPDDVHFSGDSGLKALLTKELAGGNFGFDIRFNEPDWVRMVWNQGGFPYSEPYIYKFSGKYFITFPYPFSLVTAPFYALLGYRGLYIIPLLSTLGIWIVYYLFCKKLRISLIPTCVGALLLIFSNNLSIYTALFWEHSLSVFLAFLGIYILHPGNRSWVSTYKTAMGGILSGLAVWFRPEQLIPLLIFTLILVGLTLKPTHKFFSTALGKSIDHNNSSYWVYPLFGFVMLLLYGISNLFIYHNFFGIHSIQVIEPQPLIERFQSFVINLRLLTISHYSLFAYAPLTLLPIYFLILLKIYGKQQKIHQIWNFWYWLVPMFVVGVAAMVPAGAGGKQWGPRFLLFLVPITVVILARQLDVITNITVQNIVLIRKITWGVVLIAGVIGIVQNPIRGRVFLQNDYSENKAALSELETQAEPIIVVSDQFLAQTFQASMDPGIVFFKGDTVESIFMIGDALLQQNIYSFSYVCFSFDCKLFQTKTKEMQIVKNGGSYDLQVLSAAAYGKFMVFNISISP